MDHPSSENGHAPAPFRWPPRTPMPPPAEPVVVATSPPAKDGSWLDKVERVWLDPVARPFPKRAIDADWRRDGSHRYCDACGATVAPFEGEGCEPVFIDNTATAELHTLSPHDAIPVARRARADVRRGTDSCVSARTTAHCGRGCRR